MWQLLMHRNTTTNTSSSRKQPLKVPAASAAVTSAGTAASTGSSGIAEGRGEGLQQQLLLLLRLQGSSSLQLLQRQVVVLQLMVDAQAAAGRGQRLWSDDAVRAFQGVVGWCVLACRLVSKFPEACASPWPVYKPGLQAKCFCWYQFVPGSLQRVARMMLIGITTH
jgi:hypothetical protein